ncbi:MAG: beta-N-acetylhexosaminidase [Acetobacterales bacterium]
MSNVEAAGTRQPAAAIFGCIGTTLTDEEEAFFAETDPLGFILFARNCRNPAQVAALVGALRQTVDRPDAPVLIDQEGGRVARLRPPNWYGAPPAAVFGALAESGPDAAAEAARLNARLIAADLAALGIDVDCAPVLDVPVAGAHDIIGDRAFCRSPEAVAMLGRAACEGFLDGGVLPVIKHVPGHGRARSDSHLDLPVVEASLDELRSADFLPFRALADMPLAMTAHVVYTALDPDRPATLSPRVIADVIRGEIGFSGVLISDDIGMGALGGPFDMRAAAALDAGCDVVLHCSGRLDEMREVAGGLRPLDSTPARRMAERGAVPPGFDRARAAERLSALLAQAPVSSP